MKTLYVSDLDGTLLGPDAALSPFTVSALEELKRRGVLFTFATARSFSTMRQATAGFTPDLPVIVYNGVMTVEPHTGRPVSAAFMGEGAHALLDDLLAHGIYPIVYAVIDGRERFSYWPAEVNPGMQDYLDTRRGNVRERCCEAPEALHAGEIFYISCIDEAEKLRPLYEKYRGVYRCLFQKDVYSGAQWLELTPPGASKAGGVLALKERLGAEKLVVFGDGLNDLDMFRAADEACATGNAAEEVKAAATRVIGSNREDGVARWLLAHSE